MGTWGLELSIWKDQNGKRPSSEMLVWDEKEQLDPLQVSPLSVLARQHMSHSRWYNMPILNFTQIPESTIHTRASECRLRFLLCATQLFANPVSSSWTLSSEAGQHRVSVLLLKKPRHRDLPGDLSEQVRVS